MSFRVHVKHLVSRSGQDGKQNPGCSQQLGIFYGLSNIEKHLCYFYQGEFTNTPKFSHLVKEGVLHVFLSIKDNLLAIIDAIAPPDYVLGKSDGSCTRICERQFSTTAQTRRGRIGGPKSSCLTPPTSTNQRVNCEAHDNNKARVF
ncbi:hypothetical protein MTP99_002633 [Tenebrio molitor]|nr:hypothetical protein MTP99_002633 [Tenebrio molitor]